MQLCYTEEVFFIKQESPAWPQEAYPNLEPNWGTPPSVLVLGGDKGVPRA